MDTKQEFAKLETMTDTYCEQSLTEARDDARALLASEFAGRTDDDLRNLKTFGDQKREAESSKREPVSLMGVELMPDLKTPALSFIEADNKIYGTTIRKGECELYIRNIEQKK